MSVLLTLLALKEVCLNILRTRALLYSPASDACGGLRTMVHGKFLNHLLQTVSGSLKIDKRAHLYFGIKEFLSLLCMMFGQ